MENTFIEFFAGIGLMRIALEKLGWKCVFANEMNTVKCGIYDSNFGQPNITRGDISTVDESIIPTARMATICFPCQDVSIAQRRVRSVYGERTGIVWHVLDMIGHMNERKPEFLLLENVPGLLTSNKGTDIAGILTVIRELGYTCDVLLLNANHFVPQSRERVFFLASLRPPKYGVLRLNAPVSRYKQKILERLNENRHIDIPQPPAKVKDLVDFIEDIPHHDTRWFQDSRRMYWINLLQKDTKTLGENQRYWICRRWMGKAPLAAHCPCLMASDERLVLFDLKNSTPMMRYLTVFEAAKLMGIPSSFGFPARMNDRFKLKCIGEAVCVNVVEFIVSNWMICFN